MFQEIHRAGDYIQVYAGHKFWPCDPRPEEIDIQSIARALSQQCRYSGHTRTFFSVAQHSALVSQVCDFRDALWGLLHDASEAYLIDLPRPLKYLPEMKAVYGPMEQKVMRAVCRRFGLPPEMPASVHAADNRLLATEVRDLMPPDPEIWDKWVVGIQPLPQSMYRTALSPNAARRLFLRRFEELTDIATPGWRRGLAALAYHLQEVIDGTARAA